MGMKAPETPIQPRQKRKPDDPDQFGRFVETAPKLGVDESGGAFDRAFERIAPPVTVPTKPRP
jgi:hypothetical protein